MPTLEEIAKLANVSRSTVSRVINNDPNVAENTRRRVQEVIRQVNFQPNRAARSLAGGHTRVLGLVTPVGVARLFTDPYFPLLIQGVTAACNANDHSMMLWLAEPEYERPIISQVLNNGLIDGVIVSSMLVDDPVVYALKESDLPFILIGRPSQDDSISYVDVDNFNAAREAVSHLLRLGRRKIAAITGMQTMSVGRDRLNGYLAALRAAGILPDPDLIVDGDFTEPGAYQAAQGLLQHHPDAIFAHSDPMALGAMRALREAGLRIPEEVAVIGFDDIPSAAHADPPLTTVRQPVARLGMTAAETLIDMIYNPGSSPRRIVLPTELVLRQSG